MQIRYIEYGKVFLQNAAGASDYSELDRSDNEIIARTKHFYLNEVATSNLANVKEENDNKVSFAFFHWDKKHYIFMQVEQRRENEFVVGVLGHEAQTEHFADIMIQKLNVTITLVTDGLGVITELDREHAHMYDVLFQEIAYSPCDDDSSPSTEHHDRS